MAIDDVRAEVNRIYQAFGHVADVCVITTARDVMCFVQYEDEEVALRAREATNMKTILGSMIKVNYAVVRGPDAPKQASFRAGAPGAKSPSPERVKDPNRRMIIVSNLPSDMSSRELAEVAKSAGDDISFANVWTEGDNAYGLLTFDSSREARKAKRSLHGATLEGSRKKLETLTLDEFNESVKRKKPSRSNSRDRRRR